MNHKSVMVVVTTLVLLLTFSVGRAQVKSTPPPAPVEVIQFHLEHRCVTCLKIEKLTKETLAAYFSQMPFSLVNVEKKENEKISKAFQAYGTALFLYNPKTGAKKNLTQFAFLKAGNEEVFTRELKKQIEEFVKS